MKSLLPSLIGTMLAVPAGVTALSAASLVDDCAECSFEKGKCKLCGSHAKEEAAVLKAEGKNLKDKKADVRLDALKAIAALTRAHANAPSPKVADALARGLSDDSCSVRIDTVTLLLAGQHPERVIAALADSLDKVDKEMKRVRKDYEELVKDWKAYEEIDSVFLFEYSGFVHRALEGLGCMRDPRSLEALQKMAERSPAKTPGTYVVESCRALLQLDCEPAVAAVIDSLARFDKVTRKGPVKNPFKDPNSYQSGMDILLRQYAPATPEHAEAIDRLLREFAKSKALEDAPHNERGRDKAWKVWLAQHVDLFPAELPVLEQPVQAALADPDAGKFDVKSLFGGGR